MSPLRQSMIEAMRLRGFAPRTHGSYLHAVERLARHYGRSPDDLSVEELEAYFRYLVLGRGLSPTSCRLHLNGIRFLYLQVSSHLLSCRTEAMGGQVLHCGHCHKEQTWYYSCRDRHCPLCQGVTSRAIRTAAPSTMAVSWPLTTAAVAGSDWRNVCRPPAERGAVTCGPSVGIQVELVQYPGNELTACFKETGSGCSRKAQI